MGKREDMLSVRQAAEDVLQSMLASVVIVRKQEALDTSNKQSSIHSECEVLWIDPKTNELQILAMITGKKTDNDINDSSCANRNNDSRYIRVLDWKELLSLDVELEQLYSIVPQTTNYNSVNYNDDVDNLTTTDTKSGINTSEDPHKQKIVRKMIRCVSVFPNSAAVRFTIPFVQKQQLQKENDDDDKETSGIPVSGWMLFLLTSSWQCISIALSIGDSDTGEGPSYIEHRKVRELVWGKIQDDTKNGSDDNVNNHNNVEFQQQQQSPSPPPPPPIGYRYANRTSNSSEMKRVLHPLSFRLCEVVDINSSKQTPNTNSTATISIVDGYIFCNEFVQKRYINPSSDHYKAKHEYENSNSSNVPFDVYPSKYDRLISGEFASPQIVLVTCTIGHPPALWTDFLICAKVIVGVAVTTAAAAATNSSTVPQIVEAQAQQHQQLEKECPNEDKKMSWVIIQKTSYRQPFV